ncbi:MAG: 2-oxoacid:acceptor oxidoreductase subunit alpha [Deltaproteobacteria bacterium]|nr:2-oxoacid:acceptor oxidoreductase subunit alpha [Deltaproteobacteria bacterium]
MDDINVVIAGAAGEGVQTIGDLMTNAVAGQGYSVFSWKEYESRIVGGSNSYSIRIGDGLKNAPLAEADILLALNNKATDKYKGIVKKTGIIISVRKEGDRSIPIPFSSIAKKRFGEEIYANTIAIGALVSALGMDAGSIKEIIRKTFSKKGSDIVSANESAFEEGFSLAGKECVDMCPWKLLRKESGYYVISGNEAIALGAARGNCRFMTAYPMTPSTGIITYLSSVQNQLGIFIEQAEDEISAVNMAIGASYAGIRSMTATSGGGFALMVEGISLAGMTETPLVIVLAQRPGPATGLPTRTAQGDLLFAVHAGHGEFPKMIFAPADPKDAFHKMVRAFNLAEEYQTVAIVISDQFLADSRFSVEDFEVEKTEPYFQKTDTSGVKNYRRYRLTDSGISPRLYPGISEHLVCADSDEHDEYGHITEDLVKTAPDMVKKRIAKLEGLKKSILLPEEIALKDAEVVFTGWGSTRGAILEALGLLKMDGIKAGLIHFTELWPLPEYNFPKDKTYWSIEGNILGQLARLLKGEYDIHFKGHISRHDGLPITADYIRREFYEKNR